MRFCYHIGLLFFIFFSCCGCSVHHSNLSSSGNIQKTPIVIFLNGTSSSGKTSLARKLHDSLQTTASDPKYSYVSLDNMLDLGPKIFINDNFSIIFPSTLSLFDKVVLTLLELGYNVIIDTVCISNERFQHWKSLLANYNTIYVALKSNIDTLEKREKERADRTIGLARSQLNVHDGKKYDMEFDSGTQSIEEYTESIIKQVRLFEKNIKIIK